MRIGIDISQIVHEGTGVGKYVQEMVRSLIMHDSQNEYVLFGASLRKRHAFSSFFESLPRTDNVTLKIVPLPPTFMDMLWNILHIIPIQVFTGPLDIFWSSDWTQPPLGFARGLTTIHDLTILRFPESFDEKIISVHKRRLEWAKKECSAFLCDSEATKADCISLLGLEPKNISVVYPGYSL